MTAVGDVPLRLVEVVLGDEPDAWRRAGFAVDGDGCFLVGGVQFCCTGDGDGIKRWALQVADPAARPSSVDGLATSWTSDGPDPVAIAAGQPGRHANGAELLDHLVVGSPRRDRTVTAFADELGLDVRRTTEHVLAGRPMVQTFFVLAPTIVEVVSRPVGDGDGGDGPSRFWGLAFTVADLDATRSLLGPVLSRPKDAVQPGRRIASLRHAELGISVALAFLTPRPGRTPDVPRPDVDRPDVP